MRFQSDKAPLPEIWVPVIDRARLRMRLSGKKAGTASRIKYDGRAFAEWAVAQLGAADGEALVTPELLGSKPTLRREALLSFESHVAALDQSEAAKKLLIRAAHQLAEETVTMVNGEEVKAAADQTLETTDQGEPEVEETEQTEVASPESKKAREPKIPPIHVHVAGAGGRAKPAAEPTGPRGRRAFSKSIPENARIRVYKRVRGHQSYLDEFTAHDVGNTPIQKFVKENLDPEARDQSGQTAYEVYLVADDDQDVVPALAEFIIESQPASSDDPLESLRRTAEVMKEIQSGDESKKSELAEIKEFVKQRAMNGGGGLTDILALTMMEKMLGRGKGDDDAMLKLLERLGPKPVAQSIPIAPLGGLESKSESALAEIATNLAKQITERQVQPLPPQPSLADELHKFKALSEMFRDPRVDMLSQQLSQMTSEVGNLARSIAAAGQRPQENPLASLQAAVTIFKEVKEFGKVVGDNGSTGLSGFLADVIKTPELKSAIGAGLAGAIASFSKGVPGAPQLPPGPTTPQQSARRPLPPAAAPHVKALQEAKDERAQIEALVLIVNAYFYDPVWTEDINGIAAQMAGGNPAPARAMLQQMVAGFAPALANSQTLIDRTLNVLADNVRQAMAAQREVERNQKPIVPPAPAAAANPPQQATVTSIVDRMSVQQTPPPVPAPAETTPTPPPPSPVPTATA